MMKSLLTKRLPGILLVGLVALAVGAAGTSPATAASDASVSALTGKQKKAKKRALKRCNKKRRAKQRRVCKRQVNRKYQRIAKRQRKPKVKPGKTHRVDVLDPYSYSPNQMTVKQNDSILWDWRYSIGREPHDVTPDTPWPAGVNRNDFKSLLRTGPNYTFKRQFTKPGKYTFVCSVHTLMRMEVTVKR